MTENNILFAADNHYDTHAGRILFDNIKSEYNINFYEDDWACFNNDLLKYDLVILNMISGSCGVAMPDPEAEKNMQKYLQSGKNLLLLHGSSAAFWQWDWWRAIVGYRWVRQDDPDGFVASWHPKKPFTVAVAKSRHPLCKKLQEVKIPHDEIYISMEQTRPTMTLMETTIEEGTFPMCYETATDWGGKIIGYIPGHAPDVVQIPENIANCQLIINYLLSVKE